MELQEQAAPRDIAVVTTEIRTLVRQAQQMALVYAIEIGRRLREAKSLLQHGEWGEWLKTEVEFSQSTANNFMRIFEEYGADQIGLFGAEANSQTLGNLPYTKALKLIAIPAEEREEFAAEHDVEHLSSRELERLIRERDEARSERAGIEYERARLEAELNGALEELKAAKAGGDAQAHAAKELEAARAEWEGTRAKAEADLQAARAEIKKLKENPEVPKNVMDKLKLEAKKQAAEAAKKQADKELDDLQKRLQAAEEGQRKASGDAAAARERMRELESRLRTASPEVATFKVYFDQLQTVLAKCKALIAEMQDAETAERLKRALSAVLGG